MVRKIKKKKKVILWNGQKVLKVKWHYVYHDHVDHGGFDMKRKKYKQKYIKSEAKKKMTLRTPNTIKSL